MPDPVQWQKRVSIDFYSNEINENLNSDYDSDRKVQFIVTTMQLFTKGI